MSGILAAIPVIGKVVEKGLDVIDDLVVDKDQANRLKAAIRKTIEDNTHEEDLAEIQAEATKFTKRAGIVTAEITGEDKAQRSWRPHLMYFIMGLMAFNGVLVPLVEAVFGVKIPVLEAWEAIPPPMWKVLMIGLGGYIGGRSAEKITKEIGKWKRRNSSTELGPPL